jgi:hypothetical protein
MDIDSLGALFEGLLLSDTLSIWIQVERGSLLDIALCVLLDKIARIF